MVPLGTEPAALYHRMLLIRRFEERLLREFSRGTLSGTTHTCIGQEANAVGVLSGLRPGDVVVSNHRGHGHFLAYRDDVEALAAEIMGRRSGVCGGRGGSQHLQRDDFYANGILGGTMPLAVGAALAERRRGAGAVAVLFHGDGALGEGTVYEGLNIAALWQAPLLVVVEHNGIAQTTPTAQQLAGRVLDRFAAFGIPAVELDTTDALEIQEAAAPLIAACREGEGPRALVIRTCRLGPHSKGDDTRDPEELARLWQRDPLQALEPHIPPTEREAFEQAVQRRIEAAFGASSSE